MATHTGCAELAARAIPVRLMQKRDAVAVDQIFITPDRAGLILLWPRIE
jgi:hypothetical protein